MALKTVEDITNYLKKSKETFNKLIEEYKDRYNNNKDSNKAICRNMYYQCVYKYNEAEEILAEIEGREAVMYCFSLPPFIDIPEILKEYEEFQKKERTK